MHSSSAKIKPVRPFNWSSPHPPDPKFESWKRGYESLSIEIGCGVGLHPIQWCQNHPDKTLLALERTKNKFQSFQSRINSHELTNLFPVFGDAQDWLPANVKENSVDHIFLLYPNPYPKEKQANKRWYRSPFAHYLIKILKRHGQIHFATNEKFLRDECVRYAKEFWQLNLAEERVSSSAPWSPRTHFEKKYLGRGLTCYDLIFHKTPESEKLNP